MNKTNTITLVDMEINLRIFERDLETSLGCRQGVLKHGLPESSDLFLDDIDSNRNEIEKLKREIFKFMLANEIEF